MHRDGNRGEEIPWPINRVRYPRIDSDLTGLNLGNSVESRRGIIMELGASSSSPSVTDEVMFVALGKDAKESTSVLMWALHNSRGMRICLLHVHQPPLTMPMLGTKVAIHLMEEQEAKAYCQLKIGEMHNLLDKYIQICSRAGVRAEKIWKETNCIEKGIVELISEHSIKWLVMGAAAHRQYSRKMKEPKSKIAIYVRKEAPVSCHIWFTCKGNLVHTRESKSGSLSVGAEFPHVTARSSADAVWSMRSCSIAGGNSETMSVKDYRRIRSDNHGMQHSLPFSGSSSSGGQSPQIQLSLGGNSDWDNSSLRSPSMGSHFSTSSSDHSATAAVRPELNHEIVSESELPMFQPNREDYCHSSATASAITNNDELYDRLEQFVAEAEISRREAYEESIRCKKAEKEVIDILRRMKEHESMCAEEQRRRKETEEALERTREEAAKTKWQLGKVLDEFNAVREQKSTLQHRITDADRMLDELKQKIFSAVNLLQKCKSERDELEAERDAACRVAEELREKQGEAASGLFFSEFSVSEIEEATNSFDESSKVGEGGYGGIYRGSLRHTLVAIKVLHPDSLQGPVEFRQEVNVLSRLRHPNIVNLIGACPEACALIYEYLPNGSLEDRLNCKDNTLPLPWKARVRIAAELCSALIFLHSCRPQGIIHGDLKPSNILLDRNFVCKLGDFGICRQLPRDEFTEHNGTLCWRTDRPRGTAVYIDPDFLATGELTVKSDVYSFGIILLRLLTGRPAVRIAKEVRSAMEKGNLKEVLDPRAGEWPFVQAQQLTHLAIRCSDVNRRSRPDLASEAWRVLQAMNISCGGGVSLQHSSDERREIPAYFACPIFQEVMQDPVVAADGYTYESEALKGWLESGHDTSPMTNLKLPHCDLLPNYALRSAIQEWLQAPLN